MFPALLLFDFHPDVSRFKDPVNLLNMLFLGLGASALCFATWNFAVRKLGAAKTSSYSYLVPVITVGTSVLVLKETITWITVAGMALTLAGLLLGERGTEA